MITFVFENRIPTRHGFSPNLCPDLTALPGTQAWWDMGNKPPYVYQFRFLDYMDMEGLEYKCKHFSEISSEDDIAIYPIWLNIFDPDEDYFSRIDPQVLELVRRGYVRVAFFYSEGDDPTIDIIDNLFDSYGKHNIPIGSVKFVIANYKMKNVDPFIYFCDDEVYYRMLHLREKDWVKSVNMDEREKKFTCLNRMDKPFRRLFAASLWNHGAHSEGFFSYNMRKYDLFAPDEEFDPTSNYWAPYVWDEHFFNNEVIIEQFLLNCPFHADKLSDDEHNNHKLIVPEHYQQSYWNFVVETHFEQDTTFITEKTFKPILNLQPFIIIGSENSLGLLRDLGYKTFKGYIDEEYDNIKNEEHRMWYALTECFNICEDSKENLTKEVHEMRPLLEYNQQLFLASKKDRLIKVIEQLLD